MKEHYGVCGVGVMAKRKKPKQMPEGRGAYTKARTEVKHPKIKLPPDVLAFFRAMGRLGAMKRNSMAPRSVTCPGCHKDFVSLTRRGTYCSDACRQHMYRLRKGMLDIEPEEI